MESYSAQSGTLADGLPGQIIKIILYDKAAGGSYTLTPTTKTGFNSILFDNFKEQVTLLYMDNTNGWIIVSTIGATVNY